MQEYIVNRPDPNAMKQILEKNFENAAGVILRLAWQAGLLRDEIHTLTWGQIDFLDNQILLKRPDRAHFRGTGNLAESLAGGTQPSLRSGGAVRPGSKASEATVDFPPCPDGTGRRRADWRSAH